MRRKRMGQTSTSLYLRFIATADLLVLFFGIIPEWLEACAIVSFKNLHSVTCKLEKFCHYSVNDTATWFLVAFTIDRPETETVCLNKYNQKKTNIISN